MIKARRWILSAAVVAVALVGWPQWTTAQQSESVKPQRGGVHYGEGLRHLAEGRMAQAVQHLFRAYGVEPSPRILALIVEAYDEMGHCDAADRKRAFFETVHPDDEVPQPKRCASTGTVDVECGSEDGQVVINGDFTIGCGRAVSLPAGESHRLGIVGADQRQSVDVDSGGDHAVEIAAEGRRADIARLSEYGGGVELLPLEFEDSIRVPRLMFPFQQRDYKIFRTADGLYRIFRVADPEPAQNEGGEDNPQR